MSYLKFFRQSAPATEKISSVARIGPSSAAQKIGGYSSTPQFHIPSVFEDLKQALGEGVTVRQCSGCAIITPAEKGPRIVDGQPHLYSGERQSWDSFKLMNIRYEWVVEPGRFGILVGAAFNDIRLEGEVTI